jgi:hypothetical protein
MNMERFMNFGAERIDLSKVQFTPELLGCVPAVVARRYRALPVLESGDCLHVAVPAFRDIDVFDSLCHVLKRELEFHAADREQLNMFIQRFYGE